MTVHSSQKRGHSKSPETPSVLCLPKSCSAIGIVLATPDRNRVQPRSFRRSRLNLPASNKPAPKPIAPRVAAIRAISGTVTLLVPEILIMVLPSKTPTHLRYRVRPLNPFTLHRRSERRSRHALLCAEWTIRNRLLPRRSGDCVWSESQCYGNCYPWCFELRK